VVLDAQVCQVALGQSKRTCSFILDTVPVAFNANSELVRNSVLFTPETLDIQVVTRES